jgi:urease subunit beta
MIPGETWCGDEPVPLSPGRARRVLRVVNAADRPVQVGSHYHFAEVNPALAFDRAAAWGYRLDIAAGTSVRFEPGIERDVMLVALGGRRVVPGLRRAAAGPLDTSAPPGPPGTTT